METSCYKGFFHHWFLPSLLKYFKFRDSNILPWKVYTAKDFQLHKSSKTGKTGKHITAKSQTFNRTQNFLANVYIYPIPPINKIKTLQVVQNNMQGKLAAKPQKLQINHPLWHK